MPRFAPFAIAEYPVASERVTTGALVFTTVAEMTERGRPTDEGIQGLNRDVRDTLVYADPPEVRKNAATIREIAAKLESSSPGIAANYRAVASRLEEEAAINEERMKGKDPASVNKQVSYSRSFFRFLNEWDNFYESVRNGRVFGGVFSGDIGLSGNAVADMIDSYDAQYRTFVKGYNDLGFTTATPPPPKSKAGDTLPEVNANVKGFFDSIPWGTIAVVGVVGVGGYVAYKLLSDKPSETVIVTQPAHT